MNEMLEFPVLIFCAECHRVHAETCPHCGWCPQMTSGHGAGCPHRHGEVLR